MRFDSTSTFGLLLAASNLISLIPYFSIILITITKNHPKTPPTPIRQDILILAFDKWMVRIRFNRLCPLFYSILNVEWDVVLCFGVLYDDRIMHHHLMNHRDRIAVRKNIEIMWIAITSPSPSAESLKPTSALPLRISFADFPRIPASRVSAKASRVHVICCVSIDQKCRCTPWECVRCGCCSSSVFW